MDGGSMTLVFSRTALTRLLAPAEVVSEAQQWSTAVGVFAACTRDELVGWLERTGVDPDFVPGADGQTAGLAAVRQRFPTERHVFIGTSSTEQAIAQALGWEYLRVEEAAEKAGWPLNDPDQSA